MLYENCGKISFHSVCPNSTKMKPHLEEMPTHIHRQKIKGLIVTITSTWRQLARAVPKPGAQTFWHRRISHCCVSVLAVLCLCMPVKMHAKCGDEYKHLQRGSATWNVNNQKSITRPEIVCKPSHAKKEQILQSRAEAGGGGTISSVQSKTWSVQGGVW